jgi:hydrogenase maturation protease
MSRRVLVAGLGNVFLGDDAFGVEVVRSLRGSAPEWAVVIDFGTRARDLAFALQDGYDGVVLVDATQRGGPPGTLYVLDPTGAGAPDTPAAGHDLTPAGVLALARQLGQCPPARVVGCEPAALEPAEGLSPAVAAAVGPATALACRVAGELLSLREGGR